MPLIRRLLTDFNDDFMYHFFRFFVCFYRCLFGCFNYSCHSLRNANVMLN